MPEVRPPKPSPTDMEGTYLVRDPDSGILYSVREGAIATTPDCKVWRLRRGQWTPVPLARADHHRISGGVVDNPKPLYVVVRTIHEFRDELGKACGPWRVRRGAVKGWFYYVREFEHAEVMTTLHVDGSWRTVP